MTNKTKINQGVENRRSFMKQGLCVAAMGAGVLATGAPVFETAIT